MRGPPRPSKPRLALLVISHPVVNPIAVPVGRTMTERQGTHQLNIGDLAPVVSIPDDIGSLQLEDVPTGFIYLLPEPFLIGGHEQPPISPFRFARAISRCPVPGFVGFMTHC